MGRNLFADDAPAKGGRNLFADKPAADPAPQAFGLKSVGPGRTPFLQSEAASPEMQTIARDGAADPGTATFTNVEPPEPDPSAALELSIGRNKASMDTLAAEQYGPGAAGAPRQEETNLGHADADNLPDPSKPRDGFLASVWKGIQNVPEQIEQSAVGAIRGMAESGLSAPTEAGAAPIGAGVTGANDPSLIAAHSARAKALGMTADEETADREAIQAAANDEQLMGDVATRLTDKLNAEIAANQPNVPKYSAANLGYMVANSAGVMAPTIATGAINPALGAAQMFGQVASQQYGQSRADGRTKSESLMDAGVYGASEALTEIPLLKLIGEGGKSIIDGAIRGTAIEGAGEGINQLTQSMYDAGVSPDKTIAQALQDPEEWGNVGMAMAAGGVLGGSVGAGAGAVNGALRDTEQTGTPPDATQPGDTIQPESQDEQETGNGNGPEPGHAQLGEGQGQQAQAPQQLGAGRRAEQRAGNGLGPEAAQQPLDADPEGVDTGAFDPTQALADSLEVDAAGRAPVDEAADTAAESPTNDRPAPTDGQKAAGNYKKGRTRVAGLDIAIENPDGSTRSGTDPDGTPWESTMRGHYGYVRGTQGNDGDAVDVFVKPGTRDADTAYVIDQHDKTGRFDEHKTVLGAGSIGDARQTYRANYPDGWDGDKTVTAMPIDQFKDWLANGDLTRPAAPERKAPPKSLRRADREARQQADNSDQPKPGTEPEAQPPATDATPAWRQPRTAFYRDPDNAGIDHEQAVRDALVSGDRVPADVMVDYPELAEARAPGQPKNEPAGPAQPAPADGRQAAPGARGQAAGTRRQVSAGQGRKVDVDGDFVEAAALVASNTARGNANPNYPEALQPRDRSRQSSQAQIDSIARNLDPELLDDTAKASDGAPIIGPDNVVESGNGRTAAIRRAYEDGNAEPYRQFVQRKAEAAGVDVSSMAQPVYVRRRSTDMDDTQRAEFARQANQSDLSGFSPTEQARSDAARISDDDLAYFEPGADGNVLASSNDAFLRRFADRIGEEEAGAMRTSDGRWNRRMAERVQSAVFSKAYGDDRLLSLAAEEADPDVRNVLAGLQSAAPTFARARGADGLGDLDTGRTLVDAVDKVRESRRRGQDLGELLRQEDAFSASDPDVANVAQMIDGNIRSGKRLGTYFREIGALTEKYRREGADSMFGDTVTSSDIINAAGQTTEDRNAQGQADRQAIDAPQTAEPAVSGDARASDGQGQRSREQRTEADRARNAPQKSLTRADGTRRRLGADVGDIITPSGRVGWAKASEPYEIESIDRSGDARARNTQTGSRVKWRRADIIRAEGEGVQFQKSPAPPPDTAENQAPDEPGQAPGFSLDAQQAEPLPSEAAPQAFADLLGDDARQAQAVADETRRRDGARSPDTDVPADADGGLFASQTRDIEDGPLFSRASRDPDAKALQSNIEAEYPGTKLRLRERDGTVTLDRIEVPKSQRNQGAGSAIMRRVTDYADATQQRIALSPSSDFGGNKTRLTRFYRQFGFRPNKGRHRDYSVSETMIRPLHDQQATPRMARADRSQTKTEAFARWFGDSKVVNDDGSPRVVYHGTVGDFDTFSEGRQGDNTQSTSSESGFFFSSTERTARSYADYGATGARIERLRSQAEQADQRGDDTEYDRLLDEADALELQFERPEGRMGGQNVMPAYISMENPLEIDAQGETPDGIGGIDLLIQRAQRQGRDGVIIRNFDDAAGLADEIADHYVVFRPEQIKSATGNRGTFDPNDSDIRASRDAERVPVTEVVPPDIPAADRWRRANEYYRDNLQGSRVYNESLNGEIVFSSEGRKEALHKGRRDARRMGVTEKLDEIARNAVVYDRADDRRGRNDTIADFTYAVAPVNIGGEVLAVKLDLRRNKAEPNAPRFYNLTGYSIEKPGAIDRSRVSGDTASVRGSPGQTVSMRALMDAVNGTPSFSRGNESGTTSQSYSQDTQNTAQETADVEMLQRVLRRYLYNDDLEIRPAAGVSSDAASTARGLAPLFGKRVAFFETNDPDAKYFNGLALPGQDVVYLNANASTSHTALLGHELTHYLKKERPDLWAPLEAEAEATLQNQPEYRDWLNRQMAGEGYTASDELVREEMIADAVGDQFLKPSFWQRVMERAEPGVGQRIATMLRNFMDRVIEWLGQRGFGSSRYVSDMQRFRDAAVDAFAGYADADVAAAQDGGQMAASRNRQNEEGRDQPQSKGLQLPEEAAGRGPSEASADDSIGSSGALEPDAPLGSRADAAPRSLRRADREARAAAEPVVQAQAQAQYRGSQGSAAPRRQDLRLIGRSPEGNVVAAGRVSDGRWQVVSHTGDMLGYTTQTYTTRDAAEAAMRGQGLDVTLDAPRGPNGQQGQFQDNDLAAPERGYFGEVGQYLQYKAQDKFNALKRLQEQAEAQRGERLADAGDPYLAETLYHGRTRKAMDDFDEQSVDPLMDALQKTRFRLQAIGDYAPDLDAGLAERFGHLSAVDAYLYARHAPEANARLEEINPGQPAMSGMSDAEATQVMDALAAQGEAEALTDIAARVDAMTQASRDLLVSSGLEKQETIDAWEAAYTHYVPLKGEPGGPDASVGQTMPRMGRGFDTRGNASQRRLGRQSAAQNLLANVVSGHYATIRRAEKNQVGGAMLRFAQENPSALWEVNQPMTKRGLDPVTGLVTTQPDPSQAQQDNVFSVRVKGVEHRVTFNENSVDATRIVSSLKNLGATDMGVFVKSLHWVNGKLSLLSTSLNPEFVISNFARDLQTAFVNLNDTDAADMKRIILRDAASTKAYRAIRRQQKGNRDSEWSQYYDEFLADGASTGWMEGYDSIDQFAATLTKRLDREQPGTWPFAKRQGRNLFEWIGQQNTAVENAIRLSAYVHSRKNGLTRPRAAQLAKELTVNFNRKGEAGNALNAFYLFYNAAVQGSARIIKAASSSSKARKWMTAAVAVGVSLDIANRMIAGTDDDGENRYDRIPDYVKQMNWVFMLPPNEAMPDWVPDWMAGPEGDYIKFPLPYGYNVLNYAGQKFGRAFSAATGQVDDYHAGDEAAGLAMAALNAFNPIGASPSLTQLVSPTITDPIVQWAENKNFAGMPIYPEANPFGPPPPAYTQHYSGVRPWSLFVARELNMATGGSEARPGAVNVNPELMDHLWDFATGGVGRFVAETASLPGKIQDAATGKADINAYEVPFVGKLYGTPRAGASRDLYYDRADQMRVLQNEYKLAKEDGDRGQLRDLRQRFGNETKILGLYDDVSKQLRRLSRQATDIDKSQLSDKAKSQRLQKIDDVRESLYERFNRRYHDVVLTPQSSSP